ncbi:MAG: hypothetical protein QXL96_04760 [Ignisphaera sp.]
MATRFHLHVYSYETSMFFDILSAITLAERATPGVYQNEKSFNPSVGT